MNITEILSALVARINPTPLLQQVYLPGGHRAAVVHHKDYAISIQEGPRDPHPEHVFADLADMAAWCSREAVQARWAAEQAVVLVGYQQVVAVAEGYEVCAPVVCCPLVAHPYWQAWTVLATRGWIGSGDLLEALREVEPSFAPEVVMVDGKRREIPGGARILEALRALSVGDSSEASVERDAGGMARVQTRGGKVTTSSQIPERWPLHLAAFDCAPDLQVDLEALVSWRHDREAGDLVFQVRLPLAQIALREARALVVEHLRELLPGWTVGQGEARVATPRLD